MAVHYATVLGFAYESPVVEFPVRTGPSKNADLAPFKANKGTTNLEVLDIQPDREGEQSNLGRVYNWLQMKFPNGQIGWMRGHVIGIVGDYTTLGYGVISTLVHEYTLTRSAVPATAAPAAAPAPTATPAPAPAPEKPNPMSDAAKAAKATEQQQADLAKAAEQQAAAAAPAPAVTAPSVTRTWQPIRPTSPGTAVVKASNAARGRDRGTTVGTNVLANVPRDTRMPIVAVQRETTGQQLRWVQVNFNGQNVWIREDSLSIEGDSEPYGLPWDLYPAPMGPNRWWVRGWNMPPTMDTGIFQHNGWDLGAKAGEPVMAGPAGGLVVRVHDCTKCTPEKPSVMDWGMQVGDPATFSDPGWGWGYGTFVTVRYTHDVLPQSTRQTLAQRGYPNGHLFVVYAHLQRRNCELNQMLDPNAVLGFCGNTGNSEAPHLHLEVRASATDKFTSWADISKGIMDPVVLFQR